MARILAGGVTGVKNKWGLAHHWDTIMMTRVTLAAAFVATLTTSVQAADIRGLPNQIAVSHASDYEIEEPANKGARAASSLPDGGFRAVYRSRWLGAGTGPGTMHVRRFDAKATSMATATPT